MLNETILQILQRDLIKLKTEISLYKQESSIWKKVDGINNTAGNLVLFADGDEVALRSGDESFRFLYCSGKPINEPIAWRGPIVMNSEAELDLAFNELKEDTFIKHTRLT